MTIFFCFVNLIYRVFQPRYLNIYFLMEGKLIMKQWEIWKIDLTQLTDPAILSQISEEKNEINYCIIVTGQSYLDTYHAPTVLPILLHCLGSYSAIAIEGSKQTGLFCESYITCNQILTVQRNIFIKKVGLVPENLRSKIQNKLFAYFKE